MTKQLVLLWAPAAARAGVSERQLRLLLSKANTPVFRASGAGFVEMRQPWGLSQNMDKALQISKAALNSGHISAAMSPIFDIDFAGRGVALYVRATALDRIKVQQATLHSAAAQWISSADACRQLGCFAVVLADAASHGRLRTYVVPERPPGSLRSSVIAAAQGDVVEVPASKAASLIMGAILEANGLLWHSGRVVFRREDLDALSGASKLEGNARAADGRKAKSAIRQQRPEREVADELAREILAGKPSLANATDLARRALQGNAYGAAKKAKSVGVKPDFLAKRIRALAEADNQKT